MEPSAPFDLPADDAALPLLAGIWEHAPVALHVFSATGESLYANPGFVELFGAAPPRGFNILADETARGREFVALFRRALAGETVKHGARSLEQSDLAHLGAHGGRSARFEATAFPIKNRAGDVTYVVIGFKDVASEVDALTHAKVQPTTADRSARKLAAIVERMPGGLVVVDAASRAITLSNAQALALFGREPGSLRSLDDLLGAATFTRPDGTALAVADRPIMRALSGESTPTTEYQIRRSDGELRWVEVTSAPLLGPEGEVLTAIELFHDVTVARRREREFRRLLDATVVGAALWDADGRVLDSNDAFLAMLGYDRAELTAGRVRWTEVTPPEYAPLDEIALQQLADRGMCDPISKDYVRRDGRRIPVLVQAVTLEGTATRGGALVLDVSHLRRAEQRVRAVLEAAPDGVLVVDSDGRIVVVNSQIERLFGYSRKELKGEPIEILVPERVRTVHRRHRSRFQQQPQPRGMATGRSLTARRRDGSEFPVEISLSPLTTDEGTVTIATVRDVSERHALEQRVRQATNMEAIGRLAGGIAHDFNNMLSAILGFSRLIAEDLGPDDPIRSDIEQVIHAGEAAASLTRQLLAFSRKQILEPKVINLNSAVSRTERMLRRVLSEDVELRCVLAPDLAATRVDPAQIDQVLLNLVVNARDAMPAGGTITIRTSNVLIEGDDGRERLGVEPGEYVVVAVSDTGPGIPREVRDRIFEPFYTTKSGKGTGLGLATVFGIVKQSGGHIFVHSEPGEGTTFEVYLPREDAEVAADTSLAEPRMAPRARAKILLAEDEAVVRQFVRKALQRGGYTVLEAANGEEALQIAERQADSIDLLLTDVVMPRMSGRELAERLAAIRPGVPVLYMSGYTEDAIVRKGVLEDDTHFVAKPVAADVLLRKIREILDG